MMAVEDNTEFPSSRTTTVIVGLGKTGLSCAKYLVSRGEPFVVVDSRKEPPYVKELLRIAPNVECYFGKFEPFIFEQAKRLIVSPGISIKETVISEAASQGAEITGDVALFVDHANAPFVAITGSNGKSTVVTLLGEMARKSNVSAVLGGNLGMPALDLIVGGAGGDDESLPKAPDYYVLELSSFQLETTPRLHAHAAVVLNISEDHMDRYVNLQEYINAKRNVYNECHNIVFNRDDPLVVEIINSMDVASVSSTVSIGLGEPPSDNDYGLLQFSDEEWLSKGRQKLLRVADLSLPGRHNVSNALAALALGDTMGLELDAMLSVLRKFSGLPHRMQLVATIHNVQWFNDSKGTNVGATVSAISGLPGSKVLIVGGEGKGADFEPLREAVIANNVRLVILLGKDADLIEQVLSGVVKTEKVENMLAAVKVAHKQAKAEEKIILSPACASFDMFDGYEQRGDIFMEAVRSLPL
jgi:UDP-N-acetylmuramoylalanine--D-glutamate ligase